MDRTPHPLGTRLMCFVAEASGLSGRQSKLRRDASATKKRRMDSNDGSRAAT